MDIDMLKLSYAGDEAIRAICDHMADRDKNQNETKLHRILKHLAASGFDFKRGEVIAAFRALEAAGCGKYVEGRHGWPSRFVWEIKSLHVSALARGQQQLTTNIDDGASDAADDAELLEHMFLIRPELSISLELPADLTEHEASRLATFVRALPFETTR